MLRVSVVTATRSRVELKIEGKLGSQWVQELARVADEALAGEAAVTLDLAGLSYVDESGVRLLQLLGARGVELVGASTFVHSLIA